MMTYLTALNSKNVCELYTVECVPKIKFIYSIISDSIYGAMCIRLTQFSCDDRDNVYFILLSPTNRKYEMLSIV